MESPMLSRARSAALAERLVRQHADRTPFRPFAQAEGVTTIAAAYEVQDEYVQRLVTAAHAARAGTRLA